MPKGPVRRAQLIAPFGVGSMVVTRNGVSVVCGGLDQWYKREPGTASGYPAPDPDEYRIEEWRLQRMLKVDHFRLPPDYRNPKTQPGERPPNAKITVPFLRFPQWHFCPARGCRRLQEVGLNTRDWVPCEACGEKKKTRYVTQVPFVAICESGHLQDFPWREWVHRTPNPGCQRPMKLIATGGASLAAQKVVCECEKDRTLASITNEGYVSENLAENKEPYLCRGARPWLGEGPEGSCGQPLRGSLRSASNVYFAQYRSAIYLPRSTDTIPADLIEIMESPPISTNLNLLRMTGADREKWVQGLRASYRDLLATYNDEQLEEAIKIVTTPPSEVGLETQLVPNDDYQTAFLRDEFEVLRKPRREPQLMIEEASMGSYGDIISKYFSRVMLLHKLRETRALAGFTRVYSENGQTLEDLQALLWKSPPPSGQSWLPAYIVFGEGIFLEFNEERLQKWEQRAEVANRIEGLAMRDKAARDAKGLPPRSMEPRMGLLHTFAHLLMNQLTFECGYSSAALRERLFVSANPAGPMAGLLIYTAAGDAEGTMGGLVRMGRAGYIEPVIAKALENAEWCSADPVCMEMGASGGQGPGSCNLAACHNCALVPETACERFNRFLDRGLVIGTLGDRSLGYFE